MEQRGSAVECRTRNRECPGSNPLCYCFKSLAFSFSPHRPSSLSRINEYLALDIGQNVNESSSRVIAVWLEYFPEKSSWCRNGLGMSYSAI